MLIKALTQDDIPVWLRLASEGNEAVSKLIPDISVFYDGFDEYMNSKIKHHEAFMAVDIELNRSLGIVAFSQKHNRISFIGISKDADFQEVGGKLMEVALDNLDKSKEITANVLDSGTGIFLKERSLYESFGFEKTPNKVIENGIKAVEMKRPGQKPPISPFTNGYSFSRL
jgi:predicted GNAT family N-acyltransferase